MNSDNIAFYSPSESQFESDVDEELSHSNRHTEKSTKEKSLGTLACQFIRLLKDHGSIGIEKAAEILSKNIPHKYKTKVRSVNEDSATVRRIEGAGHHRSHPPDLRPQAIHIGMDRIEFDGLHSHKHGGEQLRSPQLCERWRG